MGGWVSNYKIGIVHAWSALYYNSLIRQFLRKNTAHRVTGYESEIILGFMVIIRIGSRF